MALLLSAGALPQHPRSRCSKQKRIPLPDTKANEKKASPSSHSLQSLPLCSWKAPRPPRPPNGNPTTRKPRRVSIIECKQAKDPNDCCIFLAQISGKGYPEAIFALHPVDIIVQFEFSTFCSVLINRLRHIHILWSIQRREWTASPPTTLQRRGNMICEAGSPAFANFLDWLPAVQEASLPTIFCVDDPPLLAEDLGPRSSLPALLLARNLSTTLRRASASALGVQLKQFAPRIVPPPFALQPAQQLPNLSDRATTVIEEVWRTVAVNRQQEEVLRWIEVADKDVAHDEVDWVPRAGKCFLEFLLPLVSEQIEGTGREVTRRLQERHGGRLTYRRPWSTSKMTSRRIPLPTPSRCSLEGLVAQGMERLRRVCFEPQITWRTASKRWAPVLVQSRSPWRGKEIRRPLRWVGAAMEFAIQSITFSREKWSRQRIAREAATATATAAAAAVVESMDSSTNPADEAEPHSAEESRSVQEALPDSSPGEQPASGACIPVSSHTSYPTNSSPPSARTPARIPRVEKVINIDAGGVQTLHSLEMLVDDFMKGRGYQPVPKAAVPAPLPIALPVPSPREPGRLLCWRLPVLVSEAFLEQQPRVVGGLCSEYQVRTIDCAIRGEVDMIIDSCTAVFVLTPDAVGAKMKSITSAAMKFANIWLILCQESCTVQRADMDLFRNLARFPVMVLVRATLPNHRAITTCLAHCIHETCVAALKQSATSSPWDAHRLRSKPFLASLPTTPLLAMRCELLQTFPTINLHMAAQLLYYWTLPDLVFQTDKALISLMEELNPPCQAAALAERISSFCAVLKVHCGLVAFVADQQQK